MTTVEIKKTALITGAGSGIGRGVTFQLAEDGFTHLALADVSSANLATTAASLSSAHPKVKVLTLTTDVTDAASVVAMVKSTLEKFGRIDVSVHSAGVAQEPAGRTGELSVKAFDEVMDVNLRGLFMCESQVLAAMVKQEERVLPGGTKTRGSIVNVSSIYGFSGTGIVPGYVTSKHGVVGLTRCDALAYANDGIRVNAVCPGPVLTPLVTVDEQRVVMLSGLIEAMVPMKRFGSVEEVAKAVSFLASDGASFVTGVMLPVDGGYSAQ